ncbi:hypothetical protein HY413_00500 [Candidatus Kaiserbacteria bacterium]|nr:hypothetical protein [Candidatus Kaiserbacteria bacterium]
MAKKAAKKTVKKKVARKATKKKAPLIKKSAHGTLYLWRKNKKEAIGLISQGGAAYPALQRRRKTVYGTEPALKARGQDFDPNRPRFFFDHRGVEVLGIFDIPEGALVVYQSAYHEMNTHHISLGAALFAVDGLSWRETWRTELPIWQEDLHCPKGEHIVPHSAILKGDTIHLEWQSSKGITYAFDFPQPFTNLYPDPMSGASLTRFDGNPIITANPAHDWEAIATMNPAAIIFDGNIHLFYRALGHGGRSVFGHAVSNDGFHFTCFTDPAYIPGTNAEGYRVMRKKKRATELRCPVWGVDGAEDPRATVLEGQLHILYAAFNGYEQARAAHISAPIDGVAENALDWCNPTLLTAPPTHWGTGGKNAALLPAKIDGMYVIFHRIWPDICIDYTTSLDFSEYRKNQKRWLEPRKRIKVRPAHWDSGKVLVGAPPIETPDGWLLIYNAVSHQHNGGGYKIGAMILDRQDPSRVLYRSRRPILTSQMWYEETGLTPRVTYACGAVIKDGTLFVYYGGADTYVNVATAPLTDFMKKLKQDPHEAGFKQARMASRKA